MTPPNTPTDSVSRNIAASPEDVWSLVSDVTRMPDWSPESTKCKWQGQTTEAKVGAVFRGSNKIGWHKWSTKCTVKSCDPGRLFAFESTSGPFSIARWEYSIEPTTQGCQVTESWYDQRGGLIVVLGRLSTGIKDRSSHNVANMQRTLEQLAKAAEA